MEANANAWTFPRRTKAISDTSSIVADVSLLDRDLDATELGGAPIYLSISLSLYIYIYRISIYLYLSLSLSLSLTKSLLLLRLLDSKLPGDSLRAREFPTLNIMILQTHLSIYLSS